MLVLFGHTRCKAAPTQLFQSGGRPHRNAPAAPNWDLGSWGAALQGGEVSPATCAGAGGTVGSSCCTEHLTLMVGSEQKKKLWENFFLSTATKVVTFIVVTINYLSQSWAEHQTHPEYEFQDQKLVFSPRSPHSELFPAHTCTPPATCKRPEHKASITVWAEESCSICLDLLARLAAIFHHNRLSLWPPVRWFR